MQVVQLVHYIKNLVLNSIMTLHVVHCHDGIHLAWHLYLAAK